MVGFPSKYMPLVESIVSGTTLIFLFNFSDRQLHGVYVATSAGQANMFPKAFTKASKSEGLELMLDGTDAETEASPFPAQCSFDIVEELPPMPESEFKHVLEYTERQRFKFKLSRWQCKDLVELMCAHAGKMRAKRLLKALAVEE